MNNYFEQLTCISIKFNSSFLCLFQGSSYLIQSCLFLAIMICKLFLFQINVASFSSGEVRFFWLNATVLKHTLVGHTFTLEWSLVMLSLMLYSCKCMELITSLLRAAHPLMCLFFFPRNFGKIYYRKFLKEKNSSKVKSS